jgi:hypothetical protein
MILAQQHAHSRDALIRRNPLQHGYLIAGHERTEFTSVTTWVGSHFAKFDADKVIPLMMGGRKWNDSHECWGMTPPEIKAHWAEKGRVAAEAGTALHDRIEVFMNRLDADHSHARLLETEASADLTDEPIEWHYFLHYLAATKQLVPFRTEWMVFDEELRIAGCIDMVYQNEDGTLSIYDWKRCGGLCDKAGRWDEACDPPPIAHLADTKYTHYALQINVYKAILERQYGYTVRDMCLVQLHPANGNKDYKIWPLPDLSEEVDQLLRLDKRI